MMIDDQISVRTVLVLTDFRGQQRRFRELRKSFRQQLPRVRNSLGARQTSRRGRIDALAARVVGDFEPALMDIRNSIDDALAEIDPNRQMAARVTLRSARRPEVVDLLARRSNAVADDVRKDF